MKKISEFLSENFQFLVGQYSIYLSRRVFVMTRRQDSQKRNRKHSGQPYSGRLPSGQVTFIQRRVDVDATS